VTTYKIGLDGMSRRSAPRRDAPVIHLATTLREALMRGHPWIYRNHISDRPELADGDWVHLVCGSWQAWGLWQCQGPIAVRIFSRTGVPDTAWLRARVADAWHLRAPLRAQGCTAYRWIFGEGDGLPGITVDRYAEYAVVRAYGAAAATLVPGVADALLDHDATLRGVVQRHTVDDDDDESARLTLVRGAHPPRPLVVSEHGLSFAADLLVGQKTGLFLDHRENRRTIEQLADGRTVLNCFAYTGAFSLYALRGGAQSVISIDSGRGLADAAEENLVRNRLDPRRHTFVTADCFAMLEHYQAQQRRFDLIILDPPSFARSRQNRYAAQRAYVRLNALALRCIVPGGLLASASCTSQIGPDTFRELIAAAGAQAGRRVQLFHEAGQPLDHPVPAQFPEGRYLKFVIGRALDMV
jgi:23S rRNA (cytosine1962-C5)-methyltransferase